MGPYEWRINDIERTANEAKRRLYELDALRSDVDRVECALRESRSEVDGLRHELEASRQHIEALEAQMSEVLSSISNIEHRRTGASEK